MSNDPGRMAKWAEKTETIAKQIIEACEHLARLKDKIGFVLLPPPMNAGKVPEDTDPELGTRIEIQAGDISDISYPENSTLNAKLDEIQCYLQALNTDLAELSERVDI